MNICRNNNYVHIVVQNFSNVNISYTLRYFLNSRYHTLNTLLIAPNSSYSIQIPIISTSINLTIFNRYIQGEMPIICNKFLETARNLSIRVDGSMTNLTCAEVPSI